MKIKDLPLLQVLGDDFKIPVSDITSDRVLAVSIAQILSYVKNNIPQGGGGTSYRLFEKEAFDNLTADDMQEGVFYCEMEPLQEEENETIAYVSGDTLVVSGKVNGDTLVIYGNVEGDTLVIGGKQHESTAVNASVDGDTITLRGTVEGDVLTVIGNIENDTLILKS